MTALLIVAQVVLAVASVWAIVAMLAWPESPSRAFAVWLLDKDVPLGRLAPWVIALAIGRWPRRVR